MLGWWINRRDHGVSVWSREVRLFHWSLAVTVTASLLTGFLAPITWLRLHLIAGTTIAALLYFRVVWGLLGGRYGRFRSFIYPPDAVVRHVRAMRSGRTAGHAGHNPLGALMVFGFLFVLTAMTASGVIALGGVVKQGPLAAFTPYTSGATALAIHYPLAIALAAMVGLHLCGVTLESVLSRENLVRAMVTGRKMVALGGAHSNISPRRRLAFIIVVAGLCVGAAAIDGLARLPPRGVPPATLDPTWAEQCGACHFAYPPSLAPAWVWNGIFADLKHHYGNSDASMSPQLVGQLRAYADANSAEHWDTLPAHVFRTRDPADPGRITATPFWKQIHAGIPQAEFDKDAVGSRAACNACHADAETGRFAPQAISMP